MGMEAAPRRSFARPPVVRVGEPAARWCSPMTHLCLNRGWPILLGALFFTLTIAAGSAQTEYRPKLAVPEAMQPFLKYLEPGEDAFPLERQAKELEARLREL